MLKDNMVLITGASSGIGRACAHYFAKAGAKILLCARRIDTLHSIANELRGEYGVAVHVFRLDVRHHAEVTAAVNDLPKEWKNVNILVNNAGMAAGLDSLQEGHVEDWDAMIDTNIKGLLYVTQAFLPQMVAKNSGHIINIGSIAGHETYPKGGVYCATKHAVHVLSNALRLDLCGTKIRVSSVNPGTVETNFSKVRFKGDTKRAKTVYEGMEALTADDVADAVLYCATRPPHINISEVIIMPTDQASSTMISRHSS